MIQNEIDFKKRLIKAASQLELTANMVVSLQHDLIAIEKEGNKKLPEDNSPGSIFSKSSFRIDIYPHQGHYQGRIEHLLSGEKKAFSNFDGEIISEFISRYPPRADDSLGALETPAVPERAHYLSAAEPKPNQGATIRLVGLYVYQSHATKPTRALRAGKPFAVRISMNFDETRLAPETSVGHCTIVSAQSLQKHFVSQVVARSEGLIISVGNPPILAVCRPLPVGVYRLCALSEFTTQGGMPFRFLFRSNFIFAY